MELRSLCMKYETEFRDKLARPKVLGNKSPSEKKLINFIFSNIEYSITRAKILNLS